MNETNKFYNADYVICITVYACSLEITLSLVYVTSSAEGMELQKTSYFACSVFENMLARRRYVIYLL